ncbi:MAG: hypothetical protein JXQ29_18590, partial [Planctomycetes bacterium]|nr:hypothetical protein [Planctomycetota bacterium]
MAGTTAANGTWRITVLTDDSFELDGSTGNGAYTSGGTVVVDVWAHVSGLACYGATPPTGGGFTSSFPWINVKSAIYGAQGTGGDDTAAINAAIAAAKAANGGMGAVVYFPAGTYGVTSQILVPSRVWLVGEHSISTQIQALAGFPSATAVVRLGEGTGSVFNCRLWRLRVDANHVVGSSCVYSNEANEWSGLFDVELTNYDQYGAAFASGCSVIGVERVGGYGTNTGNSLAHLVFASVAGQSFIRDVSCAGGAGYVVADALLVTSSQVHVDGFHCERATDGIHFGSGATGIIENIYGHNSVANLIHAEGFQVTLESILPNGATNILVDDYRSYTHTTAALGHINFMSLYHWNLGLVDVRSGTQTDYRKLTIPNLGGADRTMGVEGVSALDSFAMSGAAYRLLQINATGDAARVVGIGGFTLPDEDNTHAYSILPGQLTADVTIKCPDTTHLSTYTHRLVTNNSIEELRYKTLVDSVVMRNGQTGAKAWLSSDDQTAAAEIRVPD